MSTAATTTHTAVVETSAEPRRRFWRAGVASGLAAAAATCVAVLAARAGGVAVAVEGEEIPLAGFAQFTMLGALLGVAMAKVFSRRARTPRTTFVRTTVALTALSIVPDFLVDATTGSKLVLAATHVIAAALIVPTLAARLAR